MKKFPQDGEKKLQNLQISLYEQYLTLMEDKLFNLCLPLFLLFLLLGAKLKLAVKIKTLYYSSEERPCREHPTLAALVSYQNTQLTRA